MFDVLPIDELLLTDIRCYVGSAGANAQRDGETKTAQKAATYIRSTLDARYRGGSYTKNHTRPQDMTIFTVSQNAPILNESVKDFRARANANGFKSDERLFLGYLEYRLHMVAVELNLPLNNGEIPKHYAFPEYDNMSNVEFFNHIQFSGPVPAIVKIAQGALSLDEYRAAQKTYAVDFCNEKLKQLGAL
jgi:hypothetical protein